MTTTALVFGCACLFVSGCFCGAATWHWLATREQRAERRRQERDAHDARAFGQFRG